MPRRLFVGRLFVGRVVVPWCVRVLRFSVGRLFVRCFVVLWFFRGRKVVPAVSFWAGIAAFSDVDVRCHSYHCTDGSLECFGGIGTVAERVHRARIAEPEGERLPVIAGDRDVLLQDRPHEPAVLFDVLEDLRPRPAEHLNGTLGTCRGPFGLL